ncbi:hypothetical protein [Stenotrophomonas sp. SMYL86]|uniref:hypothetical protein n=1 Tax=Stenotrophomonas sp. SMYL86 TaxID=3076044 RepID=UPI002E75AFAB|nr:hypothetical protein [Stenotrophomonas sp. SMYL86]
MRDYAKVVPKFWTGDTCKALRKKGPEGLVVALYLMSAPGSNMLGLYYQPILFMAHETGLGLEGVRKGLADCIDSGFCVYDEESEMVWVMEMAKYQIAEALKASDNRCVGIQRDYDSIATNPFLSRFFDRYSSAFNLTNRRGVEGGRKPLPSQEQEQDQEQDQENTPHTPQADARGAEGGKSDSGKPAKPERPKREKITFTAFIDACRAAGERPIRTDDPIFDFAEDAGIPREFVALAWREFAIKHRDSGKLQKDWRAHFRDAVRRNWFKLWWCPPAGGCELTTSGVQVKREREAERERDRQDQQAQQEQAA